MQEGQEREAVVGLYRSLSGDQSEATRVSFSLKFMAAQYGVNVTSKQLFGWLKGGKWGPWLFRSQKILFLFWNKKILSFEKI